MGQSTNAVLFYGFCWDEETSKPWKIGKEDDEDAEEDDEDWEERYAKAKGLSGPSRPYPNREAPRTRENNYSCTPKDYTKEEQSIIDEYSAFWAAKSKLVDVSMVQIDTHCSGDCPMPYVCIKESEVTSYRGDMTQIKDLTVKPDWDAKLAEFCKLMDINTEGLTCGWWLVSYWG